MNNNDLLAAASRFAETLDPTSLINCFSQIQSKKEYIPTNALFLGLYATTFTAARAMSLLAKGAQDMEALKRLVDSNKNAVVALQDTITKLNESMIERSNLLCAVIITLFGTGAFLANERSPFYLTGEEDTPQKVDQKRKKGQHVIAGGCFLCFAGIATLYASGTTPPVVFSHVIRNIAVIITSPPNVPQA